MKYVGRFYHFCGLWMSRKFPQVGSDNMEEAWNSEVGAIPAPLSKSTSNNSNQLEPEEPQLSKPHTKGMHSNHCCSEPNTNVFTKAQRNIRVQITYSRKNCNFTVLNKKHICFIRLLICYLPIHLCII
jgi:hypothetical protein